ncbi:MAG TPA: hypothetical protein V6D17_14680 [Candidatus Obscuribacterales bacterium]
MSSESRLESNSDRQALAQSIWEQISRQCTFQHVDEPIKVNQVVTRAVGTLAGAAATAGAMRRGWGLLVGAFLGYEVSSALTPSQKLLQINCSDKK